MEKIALLFALLSHSAFSAECEIENFSKVYRLEASQTLQARDVVKTSTCSPELTNKFAQLISTSEGAIGTDFLKTELQKDFPDIEIHFPKKKLSLFDFNTTARAQLLADSNLYFTQSRSLNGLSSLGLTEGEQLKAVCDTCQSFGEKNVKIEIVDIIKNSSRTLWFSSKVMAKIKVVKAKRNISFQQKNLDSNDFYIDEIFTMMPDNALTTLDNIRFYKSNKTILQGAVVSNQDLQAIDLVSFGTPLNLILKSSRISLQKTAMPSRSARYGETIEIKISSDKSIVGKVVDYNKAVIEL